jgi:hypothetical protein
VPVPGGKPFPHLNDSAEFRARIKREARIVRTVGYVALGTVASVLILIAWGVIRRWV